VQQRSPEYTALIKEIGEETQLPSLKVVLVASGSDLQSALENNDRLYSNFEAIRDKYPLMKYDSIRTILPAVSTQRESKAWVASLDINKIKSDVSEAADKLKFNPSVFQPFFDRLDRLQDHAEDQTNFIRYRTFAHNQSFTRLVQMHVVRSRDETRIISYLYPLEGNWESYVPDEFLADISNDVTSVEFTGLAVIAGAVQKIVKRDLVYVTFIVFLAVSLVLFLHFKRLPSVLLSVLPLGLGMIWMLGLTSIFGVDLNFVNVIVIPMIVGIGVDNGVHLLERWLSEDKNRLRYTIRFTGRALIITSLTTICGFGSLILAEFRAIREIGLLCLLGVISTFFVSIFILPAVLKLLDKKLGKLKADK
jgi:predicted RND superfamily exporter protein